MLKTKEKNQKKFHKKIDRRKKVVLFVLTLVLLALLGSFAWYVISSRRDIYSADEDVMVPYFLYLKNATDENSLNFSVGNLHPGQTISQVICVTNKIPEDDTGNIGYEISRESEFAYELELAYTENLPVKYRVYDLKEDESGDVVVGYEEDGNPQEKRFSKLAVNPMSPTKKDDIRMQEVFGMEEDELDDVVNKGTYDSYTTGGPGGTDRLTLTTSLDQDEVVYDKDFYLIEISWMDGIDFSNYTKETDLVEVIVKALQPRPSEQQ
ncbi:MAG: hypothetical protein ACI4DO_02975 [Roseburia sp.]